eukprot:1256004-Rhodomonas_salina.1
MPYEVSEERRNWFRGQAGQREGEGAGQQERKAESQEDEMKLRSIERKQDDQPVQQGILSKERKKGGRNAHSSSSSCAVHTPE